MVGDLRAREPSLLTLDGIDLAPALEQRVFFALRDRDAADRTRPPVIDMATGLARLLAAVPLSVAAEWTPSAGEGPVTVLARDLTHYPVIARLGEELREAGVACAVVLTGRAARSAPLRRLPARRLERFLPARLFPGLLALEARRIARLRSASQRWPALVGDDDARIGRDAVRRELSRISLGAAALSGVVARWRPSLLVAFDEVGTWARLLPAVGKRHGVPTLDLPHAEASDAAAIRGAGYDRMAVYGRRAAEVLRSAGIPPQRVSEIGAPRFDPLLAMVRDTPPTPEQRRVVYAAQYPAGAMTPQLLALCRDAAVAVARVVAPAELVVVPHPADPSPPGPLPDAGPAVAVRQAGSDGLHRELVGAWAMVTGWSNSVFEAAIAGVPSIAVAAAGVAPVDFAADGLALAAPDLDAASEVARSLLDAAIHGSAVATAQGALMEHIGPLDGRATERAAALALEMVRPIPAGGARMAGA